MTFYLFPKIFEFRAEKIRKSPFIQYIIVIDLQLMNKSKILYFGKYILYLRSNR